MPMISSYGRCDHRTETAQYGTYPLGQVRENVRRPQRSATTAESRSSCRILSGSGTGRCRALRSGSMSVSLRRVDRSDHRRTTTRPHQTHTTRPHPAPHARNRDSGLTQAVDSASGDGDAEFEDLSYPHALDRRVSNERVHRFGEVSFAKNAAARRRIRFSPSSTGLQRLISQSCPCRGSGSGPRFGPPLPRGTGAPVVGWPGG